MSVTLPGELEEFVAAKVASGYYTSPGDVLREALHLLDIRDRADLEGLRAAIRIGLDQADRGELVDGPAAFEAIRARLRTAGESGR